MDREEPNCINLNIEEGVARIVAFLLEKYGPVLSTVELQKLNMALIELPTKDGLPPFNLSTEQLRYCHQELLKRLDHERVAVSLFARQLTDLLKEIENGQEES